LSDAREKHFELGKGPKGKVARDQFERAWSLLLEVAGDVTLENLRRDKANEFVARMVTRGNGPETIKRYLSQVRPVINTGIREFELNMPNPFDAVVIPNREESPRKPRGTFSMEELEAIQSRCVTQDDERRWALAMLSDTMTRLAEVVGLRKSDVYLDAPIPYINGAIAESW
jgi:integrase